jgi:hypothetical protein
MDWRLDYDPDGISALIAASGTAVGQAEQSDLPEAKMKSARRRAMAIMVRGLTPEVMASQIP